MRTLFIILFFISSTCLAQSPKIKVVGLYGQYGFTCEQTLQLYRSAAYWIESQPGIRTRFKFGCLPWKGDDSLENASQLFFKLRRGYKRRLPTKIVSVPLISKERIYTGGLAYVGLGIGFGWSFITPTNQDGYDRSRWALVTITHELGHMMGAYHDESQNSVMSTNVLFRIFADPNLEIYFTQKSIKEIRKEIRFWKRNIHKRTVRQCSALLSGCIS